MLCTFSRNRLINRSYTSDCTMRRVPDTHVWPEATNEANAAPFTADSTSASSKITIGAFRANDQFVWSAVEYGLLTFPPNSAVYEARLAPTMAPRARPVDVPAYAHTKDLIKS